MELKEEFIQKVITDLPDATSWPHDEITRPVYDVVENNGQRPEALRMLAMNFKKNENKDGWEYVGLFDHPHSSI